MEKVKDNSENIVDIFENQIEYYLFEFFGNFIESDNSDDIKKYIVNCTQNQFNGALMYICRKVFHDRTKLKDNNIYKSPLSDYYNNSQITTNYNKYNSDILDKLCDYYIYLCTVYNKTVSINGYCKLLGIPNDTITSWGEPTCESYRIFKKLVDERENSLTNLLSSGKVNPVGIIAILNHKHGWNTSATPDVGYKKKALPANELPTIELLSDNSQHNAQSQ